jgi:signal transduction histidine kinase
MQLRESTPLADRLERLTNQLVNKAEADVVAGIEASTQAYQTAQWIVVAFAIGSIALALGLGYVISWSLVGPVKKIEAQLNQVAAGDFTQRVKVANRDELGALAADVNRMSAELGRLYQQLELASKHKSQFLANMSHELRTPLNAILGYAELMADGAYGEPSEKMFGVLKRLEANGKHLLGLINDVLDLSKIEAGQLVLELSGYCIQDIAQTVRSTLEPLAADKKLGFKVEVAPRLPSGPRRRAALDASSNQSRRQCHQVHGRRRSRHQGRSAQWLIPCIGAGHRAGHLICGPGQAVSGVSAGGQCHHQEEGRHRLRCMGGESGLSQSLGKARHSLSHSQ